MKKSGRRKAVAILTAAALMFALCPAVTAAGENPFGDVTYTDLYYEAVMYCYEAGITEGTSETAFTPNGNLTRAMFVTMLGRAAENMGLKTSGYSSQFTDVEKGSWYDTYVGWAAAKGFVTGTSETTFRPKTPVTREQAAVILIRFADKLGLKLETVSDVVFADMADVSGWASASMQRAVSSGLAIGYEEGWLRPQAEATRAETAVILHTLCARYIGGLKLIDSFGRYIKVFDNLPTNRYAKENFSTLPNGWKTYADGETTSLFGVDVSRHQGAIDWARVRAAGVEFAMLRVGYRGYSVSGGAILDDSCFADNIRGALENGIKVGVYFFSQAVSVEEALAEADYVLSKIREYDVSFPVVFDWENISGDTARTDNVSAKTLTDCAIAFCDAVAAEGYTPMIYFNQYISLVLYDLSRLGNYDFWLAEYNSVPNFYYHFTMWQYTSSGRVDGISGNVDMNISFVDYSEYYGR